MFVRWNMPIQFGGSKGDGASLMQQPLSTYAVLLFMALSSLLLVLLLPTMLKTLLWSLLSAFGAFVCLLALAYFLGPRWLAALMKAQALAWLHAWGR